MPHLSRKKEEVLKSRKEQRKVGLGKRRYFEIKLMVRL